MITITLIRKVNSKAVSEKAVKKVVSIFNKFIKVKQKLAVNIILVDNQRIKEINRIYRHKNKITDVLSFSYDKFNGEIIISYPQAKKQAQKNDKPVNTEINKLIIHGLLHIVGYDHVTKKQAAEMETWEEKILNYA